MLLGPKNNLGLNSMPGEQHAFGMIWGASVDMAFSCLNPSINISRKQQWVPLCLVLLHFSRMPQTVQYVYLDFHHWHVQNVNQSLLFLVVTQSS